MSVLYGSQILPSSYGSQILPSSYGSAYLSRKHLKRAIKYGSYYGGAPGLIGGYDAPVVHSSVAAAPVVYGSQSGIYGSSYLSRKHLKRAIKYGSYYGGALGYGSYYGAAPVAVEQREVSESSAPVISAPVIHAPLYGSRYHTKGGYQSTHYYGHHIGGYGAPVVHSSVAAAPVVYGSQSGIYGSSYLSSKHLKRAIKYGSYYGGAYGGAPVFSGISSL